MYCLHQTPWHIKIVGLLARLCLAADDLQAAFSLTN